MYLSGCMRWTEPNRKKGKPKKERRRIWTYTVSYNSEIDIQLCKALFIQIFNSSRSATVSRIFVPMSCVFHCFCIFDMQVSSKCLRILQQKIVKNDTFNERRGKYVRKNKIITEELRALMNIYLLSIPHTKSHYTNSQMRYRVTRRRCPYFFL